VIEYRAENKPLTLFDVRLRVLAGVKPGAENGVHSSGCASPFATERVKLIVIHCEIGAMKAAEVHRGERTSSLRREMKGAVKKDVSTCAINSRRLDHQNLILSAAMRSGNCASFKSRQTVQHRLS
jgi:hypothetical protein